MGDGLPVGRLVAIGHPESGTAPTSLSLQPGELRETLAIDGQPVAELRAGTRLGVGDTVVVEVTGATEPGAGPRRGGLRDATTGVGVRGCVVAGGRVRVGDAVVIEVVPVPLEDSLDLHAFPAAEVPGLVREYLEQARAAGLGEIRIIHGRGRGVQRETVRRVLAASPLVATFADAPPERGGWGATLVRLGAAPERRG